MKGKRAKNKKFNFLKIIVFLFEVLLITIVIYCCIKIFEWIKENQQRNDILNEIQNTISFDEENVYNVDFKSLKQKNPDTIAWFKINETDIEYPIVKANDNEYYLTHDFYKSYNNNGWAFMDYRNKCDGTDKNIIIYGHNRRDGGMFATLKNILTDEWQNDDNNFIIPFITEKEKEEYKVFSIYKIEMEEYYLKTNFNNTTEFESFINKIKSRSIKDFKVDVKTDDKILTVSTCADDNQYRVVLHARKME